MKTSSKMLFMTMTLMSTIIVVSSSSWLNMWVGLEINMMSFIPMISMEKNTNLSQSTMMYFLTQSMASMIFMATILVNKYFILMSKTLIKTMILFSMMMKMGMPPFHMWFPEMMDKMNWMMCFMLMTWQKISPMYIISMIAEINYITLLVICLSALMGGIGGINQTSTRKMMAYSSINHMSWLMSCAAMFKSSWMMYMLMYMLMMMSMSMIMYKYNILFFNQMNIFFKKPAEKVIIIMMMLSISGLPPFLGFLPKWMTIQYMISSDEYIMMVVMIMSSLITMSYYLRMTSSLNLMSSHFQKWMNIFSKEKLLVTFTLMVNMLLPVVVILLNFT